MQRYSQFSNIIKVSQGKRRYGTIYYPKFPPKDTDTYIIAKRSDRLDNLAFQHYQDPRFYWIIQRENNLPKGSFMIPPGQRIRIPSLSRREINEALTNAQF